jgi:hypothetical protein
MLVTTAIRHLAYLMSGSSESVAGLPFVVSFNNTPSSHQVLQVCVVLLASHMIQAPERDLGPCYIRCCQGHLGRTQVEVGGIIISRCYRSVVPRGFDHFLEQPELFEGAL